MDIEKPQALRKRRNDPAGEGVPYGLQRARSTKDAVSRIGRLVACPTAVLCAIGLFQPGPALAAAAVELTGEPAPSGLTGFPGSRFTLGDPDSTSRALVGVVSRERSDDPCFVSVGWEDVNRSSVNGASTKDLCGGNGPSSGTMGATYANTGGTANRVFITGAQVCMDRGDDKIKGIHLRGQRINDAGKLEDFGPDAQDARINCHQDHWKRWVGCPAGQIATAAIIHFEAGNTPRSWTGIELRCRGLRITGTTSLDTSESVVSNRLADVIDCSATEEADIRSVASGIVKDWSNFGKSMQAAIGDDPGKCIQGRFSANGKVQCVHEKHCNKDGSKCKLGFGAGLGTKIKIFGTFFANTGAMPQPDRQACYAALMTHEFSHTCELYAEAGPEARARAAFNYWKGRFAVSSGLKIDDHCGMND
jgi:hypothetical protein